MLCHFVVSPLKRCILEEHSEVFRKTFTGSRYQGTGLQDLELLMLSTEVLTNPDQWLAFSQPNFISGPVSLLCHHHYAGSGMIVRIYMGKPAIDEDGGDDDMCSAWSHIYLHLFLGLNTKHDISIHNSRPYSPSANTAVTCHYDITDTTRPTPPA
ncbi:hypothetical protein P692DRAFT_20840363 [Suillus brevipes Sb2]|nr:hypothetical protein P692DRAFT_20840363 [Suillus brevipes Sb2]